MSQALNDEPDTCSFELRPQAPPAPVPQVGRRDSRRPGRPAPASLFHGYIVTTQADWRLGNLQPPWLSVQCQDAMWRVRCADRDVSLSRAIGDGVDRVSRRHFCNRSATSAHPLDFTTAAVQAAMPAIAGVRRGQSAPVDRHADADGGGRRRLLCRRAHGPRLGGQRDRPDQPNPPAHGGLVDAESVSAHDRCHPGPAAGARGRAADAHADRLSDCAPGGHRTHGSGGHPASMMPSIFTRGPDASDADRHAMDPDERPSGDARGRGESAPGESLAGVYGRRGPAICSKQMTVLPPPRLDSGWQSV